jgi:N-acetylmuramoyl-L-alanine amidase
LKRWPGNVIAEAVASNEEERELLKQEDYQEQMAASIYRGVLRYVTEEIEEVD